MHVRIEVNGSDRDVEVGEYETLQSALRWRCGLASVRSTCGIGVCGACTVLVDGQAISSCLMPAALADGRSVSTAEGLREDDPIVRAFVDEHAFQCSYCTPALVMATKALLAGNPSPDDEQIKEQLSGNLCRCGSYYAILAAVRSIR